MDEYGTCKINMCITLTRQTPIFGVGFLEVIFVYIGWVEI